jgi:HEPN domain-containing protein
MNEQRDEVKEISTWIKIAEDDLRSAEYLLTMGDSAPFNVICFHAQQSAEKYLKSLLIYHEVDFAKTHDLIVLLNWVPPSANLAVNPENLLTLNRYGIQPRYPGDWWPYSKTDAEEAVVLAKAAREAVRDCLPASALAGEGE